MERPTDTSPELDVLAPPTALAPPRSGRASRDVAAPGPRGPLSGWVLDRLSGRALRSAPSPDGAAVLGDDAQLALYLCYESHYSAVPGAVDDNEWDVELISFRRAIERGFVAELRELVGTGPRTASARDAIVAVIDADDGPSLSTYMEERGTLGQMREFVVHRSPYQLKEGDPHTFAIPRLRGRAKQLLTEIQAGEYGADGPDREMHSTLFASTMRALDLDDRPHAYLDALPGTALAVPNLISLFGLNRRWRGALVGHLAVFEMTSVTPMGRYSRALERLGAPIAARRFYDVHVLADAEHEVIALEMAGCLADDEPDVADDIVFGAGCVVEIERRFATALLERWGADAPLTHHAA